MGWKKRAAHCYHRTPLTIILCVRMQFQNAVAHQCAWLCICSARRLAVLKRFHAQNNTRNFNVPLLSTKCADHRFTWSKCVTFFHSSSSEPLLGPEKWKANGDENLKTYNDRHVGIRMCTLFKMPAHTWTVTRNAISLRKVWNVYIVTGMWYSLPYSYVTVSDRLLPWRTCPSYERPWC
jgi:hypothetical protein